MIFPDDELAGDRRTALAAALETDAAVKECCLSFNDSLSCSMGYRYLSITCRVVIEYPTCYVFVFVGGNKFRVCSESQPFYDMIVSSVLHTCPLAILFTSVPAFTIPNFNKIRYLHSWRIMLVTGASGCVRLGFAVLIGTSVWALRRSWLCGR